jgi:hypothetical protein
MLFPAFYKLTAEVYVITQVLFIQTQSVSRHVLSLNGHHQVDIHIKLHKIAKNAEDLNLVKAIIWFN